MAATAHADEGGIKFGLNSGKSRVDIKAVSDLDELMRRYKSMVLGYSAGERALLVLLEARWREAQRVADLSFEGMRMLDKIKERMLRRSREVRTILDTAESYQQLNPAQKKRIKALLERMRVRFDVTRNKIRREKGSTIELKIQTISRRVK